MTRLALVLIGLLWAAGPAWSASTLATAADALAVGSWTSITPGGKATIDASLVTSFGSSASYDVNRRQIAPRRAGAQHPEHRVEKQPVIVGDAAPKACAPG